MKKKMLAACIAAFALALVAGCSSGGGDDGWHGIGYDPAKWVIEGTKVVRYTGAEADVRIPDGVTIIENNAFKDCKSLKSVMIPNGVTAIGEYAFYYCESLKSVTIPDGVTAIDDYAFSYCYSLASVTIPGSVKIIGDYAFFTSGVVSVTIGYGVESIGFGAFLPTWLPYTVKEVRYGGTKEQWNAIVGKENAGFDDATIVFEGEAN